MYCYWFFYVYVYVCMPSTLSYNVIIVLWFIMILVCFLTISYDFIEICRWFLMISHDCSYDLHMCFWCSYDARTICLWCVFVVHVVFNTFFYMVSCDSYVFLWCLMILWFHMISFDSIWFHFWFPMISFDFRLLSLHYSDFFWFLLFSSSSMVVYVCRCVIGFHVSSFFVVSLSTNGRKFLTHQFTFLEPPFFWS